MTQEQDIVDRLLDKAAASLPLYRQLYEEAAKTIAALRAERDEWACQAMKEDDCRKMWQERAEAAEAKIKELEKELYCQRYEAELLHDDDINIINALGDERDTAIRERDDARVVEADALKRVDGWIKRTREAESERDEACEALEPFAKLYDTEEVSNRITDTVLFGLKISDLRRARDASSNREGGE
jgi:hypothetical protein